MFPHLHTRRDQVSVVRGHRHASGLEQSPRSPSVASQVCNGRERIYCHY